MGSNGRSLWGFGGGGESMAGGGPDTTEWEGHYGEGSVGTDGCVWEVGCGEGGGLWGEGLRPGGVCGSGGVFGEGGLCCWGGGGCGWGGLWGWR